MPNAIFPVAVGIALLVTATSASALGFGRAQTRTHLGQPLDFVATLVLDADESVPRECVAAEVHAGDNRLPSPNVRVVLEGGNGPARRVRVTSLVPIDEPVVAIEVTIGCGSKLSRRFVTFIDPPGMALADAEPMPGVEPRVDARVAALADLARRADRSLGRAGGDELAPRGQASARVRQRDRAPERDADRRTRVAMASSRGEPAAPRRAAARRDAPARAGLAVASAGGGPRLRLDAAPPIVAMAPAAVPSPVAPATAPAPPATTAVAAPSLPAAPIAATTVAAAPVTSPGAIEPSSTDASALAELRRERARLDALESGMTKLRNDAQASQQTIATLQARLRQAEDDKFSNWAVYSLAAFAVLMALVAYAFWWLRPRQKRRSRWFDAQASRLPRGADARAAPGVPSRLPAMPGGAAGGRGATPSAAAPLSPPSVPANSQWRTGPDSLLPSTAPATIGGLEVTTVLGPASTRASVFAAESDTLPVEPPRGELSMEELIDLEQQAEFFVVLGQEEAAIALLEAYVRGDGGQSPLPYLQLLELHQKRKDPVAYESVRSAFNERFAALAPEWSDDLHFGRSLEGYAATVARLQALWPTPLSAMQTLDAMLFRRQANDETYDFPAYRELLFLYGIARDLAGQVETDFGAIDLFLPLEDASLPRESPMTPMEASARGGAPFGSAAGDVDLDVSRWPEDAALADTGNVRVLRR